MALGMYHLILFLDIHFNHKFLDINTKHYKILAITVQVVSAQWGLLPVLLMVMRF